MAAKAETKDETAAAAVAPKAAGTTPRKIPGNLPYLPASGTLKKALDRLVEAARPPKYNADFLENVLKLKGGSARGTIPIMKRMGFVGGDGSPTELYAKFRTQSGRGEAALEALRNGWPEIFRRSEYAHAVDDAKLKDIIVEITGLKANDPVAVAIRSTFNVVKSYVPANIDATLSGDDEGSGTEEMQGNGNANYSPPASGQNGVPASDIRLAYNINIVLPETSDLKVLNAIFRSIKENLMR